MIGGTQAKVRQPVYLVSLFLISMAAFGQDSVVSDDEAARLERAAEDFEARARILMLFDRDGNVTGTVGEKDMYQHATLSPDGNRIAVVIADLVEEKQDLWVIDIATEERTAITAHAGWDAEWAASPVWSSDGLRLAYVGKRDGYEGVYVSSADGKGDEELFYRHPGADLWIGDWSRDSEFLSVSTSNITESFLYLLSMKGSGERGIRELLHADGQLMAGNFSADGRQLSYGSEKAGSSEVHVMDIVADGDSRPVSDGRGLFVIRGLRNSDDNEFFYLGAGEKVTAVRVGADSQFDSIKRKSLFILSPALRPGPQHMSATNDGERFLIAIPHSPQLVQITVLDRQGKVLQRLGEPGLWRNPTISPDGKKVAVRAWIEDTDSFDIWSFDLESGAAIAVTDDLHFNDWPVWSPDGLELAYMSQRDEYSRIFRKSGNGSGDETELFKYEPGAFLTVTDWSPDGQFVSFNDISWGVLYVLPLAMGDNTEKATAMEWLRDEYQVAQARFSPDSRHIAYLSDEANFEVFDLFIAPFDPRKPDGRVEGATPTKVSAKDVLGMVSWHEDGNELYYLTKDWQVMAVDVNTETQLDTREPRVLFELPEPLLGEPKQWKNITPDGQRFVFTLNVPVKVFARQSRN